MVFPARAIMPSWTSVVLSCFLLTAAGQNSQAPLSQEAAGRPREFLRRYVEFTDAELAAMEQGKTVAKTVKSGRHDEVAAFAVVRVEAPREVFLSQFRDIEKHKKSKQAPLVKKFSNPPRAEDVAELEFESGDVEDMKKCRVGKCEIKLSAGAIERFQKEIDWSAPDAARRATALARSMLLEYVARYQEGGNAALREYNDKKAPLRLAEEFEGLLEQSPYIYEYWPEFHDYLRNYPRAHLENAEDFFYWSKEKYGLKPVITVTHVTVYRRANDPGAPILIASKQIYASHYFEASLGLTALAQASRDPARPAFYLMYLNRSRADALRGGFSGLARGAVAGRMKDSARENMELTRKRIEAVYAGQTSAMRGGAPPAEGRPQP